MVMPDEGAIRLLWFLQSLTLRTATFSRIPGPFSQFKGITGAFLLKTQESCILNQFHRVKHCVNSPLLGALDLCEQLGEGLQRTDEFWPGIHLVLLKYSGLYFGPLQLISFGLGYTPRSWKSTVGTGNGVQQDLGLHAQMPQLLLNVPQILVLTVYSFEVP